MVGPFDVVFAGRPGMHFEHAHLHERDEAGEVVDQRRTLRVLPFSLTMTPSHGVGQRAGEMLLVEALARVALGAAHQRERPLDDVRQNPIGDLLVVLGQVALGESVLGIQHAVGIVSAARRRPSTRLRRFAIGRRFDLREPRASSSPRFLCRFAVHGAVRCSTFQCGRRLRHFADDLLRRLVFAQALKRRMPQAGRRWSTR